MCSRRLAVLALAFVSSTTACYDATRGGGRDLGGPDLGLPFPVASDVTVTVEPGPGMAPVIAAMDGARTTLDLAIYFLSDDTVTSAILRAKDRGVAVRVLLDPNPQGLSNGPAFNQLAA